MAFAKQEGITPAQEELYLFIISFIEEHGFQPSMTEQAEHFGISVKAVKDRQIQLAVKGFVELPPRHSDRCLRFKHVRFTRVVSPERSRGPDRAVEPNPVTGPLIRAALVEYFHQRDNAPATVAEMAAELRMAVQKVYVALEHGPGGRFEALPGRPQRWRLTEASEASWRRGRGSRGGPKAGGP
jgi:hypothetical protein